MATKTPRVSKADLQAENLRLRAALEEILDPLKAMKQRAFDEGVGLNLRYAMDIAESPRHMQDIARRALNPEPQ